MFIYYFIFPYVAEDRASSSVHMYKNMHSKFIIVTY